MKSILALSFVLVASAASAQTHPCDIPVVQNPNLTSPVKATFCHTGKESDGTTPIASWQAILDGTATVFKGPLSPIGVANAAGLFYFETSTFQIIKGTHAVIVVGLDTTGTEVIGRSPSFPFGVSNPLGAAPSNVGVKK